MGTPRDYLVSLIRTGVPMLWGAGLAWLVSRQIIDADTAQAATGAGTLLALLAAAVCSWAYYAVVRLLEPRIARLPVIGTLLVRILIGSAQAPAYTSGRHATPD